MSMGENVINEIPKPQMGQLEWGISQQRSNLSCTLCLRLHEESMEIWKFEIILKSKLF